MSLPACRHRGAQVGPDQWRCASPFVIVPSGIVSGSTCRCTCPLVARPIGPIAPTVIGQNAPSANGRRSAPEASTVQPVSRTSRTAARHVTDSLRPRPIPAVARGTVPRPRYVTCQQLAADTLRLVPKLPHDLSAIVGVARSGMFPASLLAMTLHLPLYALDQSGCVRPCGHGWRLGRRGRVEKGPVLIVDDTVGSGTSLAKTRPIAIRHFRRMICAAIYANPLASLLPDLWVESLNLPHVLEWNFPNSIVTAVSAFDLDGIICHDEHSGAKPGAPRTLPRRQPIHIITGRRESDRMGTLAWLDRWGVQVASLTMMADGDRRLIAEYKAEAVRRFAATAHTRPFGPPMYVESCPQQAKRIAALSGVMTVCPASQEVYGPEGCWR